MALILFLMESCFHPLPGLASLAKQQAKPLLLREGERLQILVDGEEELSGDYKIHPDGRVALPLVGELPAAGLAVNEFEDRLHWNFKKFLVDPRVEVLRSDSTVQSLTVLGHVKRPGNYDYTPGLTLIRLISQAGGFEAGANKRRIRIVREAHGRKKVFFANGSQIISGKDDDPDMEPGDMISVPESIF